MTAAPARAMTDTSVVPPLPDYPERIVTFIDLLGFLRRCAEDRGASWASPFHRRGIMRHCAAQLERAIRCRCLHWQALTIMLPANVH